MAKKNDGDKPKQKVLVWPSSLSLDSWAQVSAQFADQLSRLAESAQGSFQSMAAQGLAIERKRRALEKLWNEVLAAVRPALESICDRIQTGLGDSKDSFHSKRGVLLSDGFENAVAEGNRASATGSHLYLDSSGDFLLVSRHGSPENWEATVTPVTLHEAVKAMPLEKIIADLARKFSQQNREKSTQAAAAQAQRLEAITTLLAFAQGQPAHRGEADEIAQQRKFFAEEIRAVSNIQSQAVIHAFEKVPREHFLGPGPWKISTPEIEAGGPEYLDTPDTDPRHLYHNVMVAIDPQRKLNNGQPSALALWIEALGLSPGDRALHIGCGVGYYSAILADIVGPEGSVVAMEIDELLAQRCRRNLQHLNQVEVRHADGSANIEGTFDAIFVNAGATHISPKWLDALKPGGRLVVPLTIYMGEAGFGAGSVIKVTREAHSFPVQIISSVAIYPCLGMRNELADQKLRQAMAQGAWKSVQVLRRDRHNPSDKCIVHLDDCCFSKG